MNSEDIRILIDFGSTYTKVVAVDLDEAEIVAQTRVPSTVSTDVTIGLKQALEIVSAKAKIDALDGKKALACSSAAGGLRMVCVGFVPEYTSEAANLAALGAGAKVVGRFSHELDKEEIAEIETIAPDIVLLTGGTDGGNKKVIIHNARLLSRTVDAITNIIVAGNKAAYDDIRDIFAGSQKRVIFTRNVMPEIGKLDLAPCHAEIRELFMRNIVEAKGIGAARRIIEDIIMPTPSAVLEAAKLISKGCSGSAGLGDLLVVDTGGSTTNVHSIAAGHPKRADIITAGLPEPYEKRTVEGDLGLRYNLDTLVDVVGEEGISPQFAAIVESFRGGKLPEGEEEVMYHRLLSHLAVQIATDRHAGKIEEVYGPTGRVLIQRGKDLTGVNCVIGTGGALAFSQDPASILRAAAFDEKQPSVLKPRNPQFFVDERYILYAIGLLSQSEPVRALALARKYLRKIE